MIGDPGTTPYDLRFRLAGVPVRVHPLFWLVAVLLGSAGADALGILVWVGVVFVSILVHEMGHALAVRARRCSPRIALYGMGGLTMWDGPALPAGYRAAVSFAGPAAGFALAGLVVASLYGLDRSISFLGVTVGRGALLTPFEQPLLWRIVLDLLFVNVFWGAVNLLPVYPLDGGQIAASFLGVPRAVAISVFAGAAAAVAGYLVLGSIFAAILFGLLAFENWQRLRILRRPTLPW